MFSRSKAMRRARRKAPYREPICFQFSSCNLICPPLMTIIAKAIAESVRGQLIFAAGQNVFPRGRWAIAKGQGFEMAAFRGQMPALYGQMAAFRGVMAAFQMDAPKGILRREGNVMWECGSEKVGE